MTSVDDDKGGPYHGPYAWPGGVPIVSAEKVDEVRKMQPVFAAIREEVVETVCMIIDELFPNPGKEQMKAIEDVAFAMSYV
ncbi:MAG: hypothetical protein WC788_09735 [Candidatus Paceibacterota bacterium]|jgi:hypothetical protein